MPDDCVDDHENRDIYQYPWETSVMPRLFVAIELPESIKEGLNGLCSYGIQGVNWVNPNQFHLSLRFIGEVDQGTFDNIADTLIKIKGKPFMLSLTGVGTFPQGKSPKVIWAGVTKNEQLIHLQKKVETRLNQIGIQKEKKRFSPHITLARVKGKLPGRIGDFLGYHSLYHSGEFEVDSFHLFSSVLNPKGAIYRKEREYPLI